MDQKLRVYKSRFVPSPMPDPAPFLHAGEKVIDSATRPRPSVLPPITSRPEDSTFQDDNGNRVQSRLSYPNKPVPERLALNRVISSDRKQRRNEVRDM